MNTNLSAQKLKKYQYKLNNLLQSTNQLTNKYETYQKKIRFYSNELIGGVFENPVYERVLRHINIFMTAFILPNVLTEEERKNPTTLFLTSANLADPKYQKEINKPENLSRFRDLLLNPVKIVKTDDGFKECTNPKWDYYVWISNDQSKQSTTEYIVSTLLGLDKNKDLTKISLEQTISPFNEAQRLNITKKFANILNNYELYKFNDCLIGYVVRQIVCAIHINNVYANLPKNVFNFDFGTFFGQVTGGIPGIAMAAITFDYKGAAGALKNNSMLVSESLKLNDTNQINVEYIYKKDRNDCGWCRFMDNLYNSN